ncbi:MAG: hypothetical protein GF398_06490 [Chitinivibrionales bacterium]|nr:hypothetical protein [Chitinivibrionales bacterium]
MAPSYNRIIQTLSSLKLTVVCLIYLIFLTIFGTLYQIDNGLWAAKQRYFHSWIFLAWKVFPVFGGATVMSVLTINLAVASVTMIKHIASKIGLLLVHYGLIVLLAGAGITHLLTIESFVTLAENGSTNVSTAYHTWELALLKPLSPTETRVTAIDIEELAKIKSIAFADGAIALTQHVYFPNSRVDRAKPPRLVKLGREKDPEKNLPGCVVTVAGDAAPERKLLLHASTAPSAPIQTKAGPMHLVLRKKHYLLPFDITLMEFTKEVHGGTDIPSSFESTVALTDANLSRDIRIYMNNPLRYDDLTFYQASYAVDPATGREMSTFAVVKNAGRLLPYISSIAVFLGLVLHFALMLVRSSHSTTKF